MRAKAILFSAALLAAGAATSMAQVYSVNAVGYVNLTLPAGFSIIANPLNGNPDNSLDTILPLPAAGDQAIVYRWDSGVQNYTILLTFFNGFGWFDPAMDPNNLVVNPGEGFFINLPAPGPFNVTLVGEVPQGSLSNPLVPGLYLVASQVPQGLPIGDTVALNDGDLDFPAADQDILYLWNGGGYDLYTYFGGFGWFDPNSIVGAVGPVIPVATGFFVSKTAGASWDRTFSVN
jgi:hypothetical protein